MDRHTEKRQPHRLMLFAMSVIACVVWYVQLGTNFNCLPAQQAAEEFSKLSISRFLMLYKRFVLNNPLATVLVRLPYIHTCLQNLPIKVTVSPGLKCDGMCLLALLCKEANIVSRPDTCACQELLGCS